MTTNEFSFILKVSEHGIGVFAVHDIREGTYLRLFGDEIGGTHNARMRNKKDIPEIFHNFCTDRGDKLWCPEDFAVMPMGWYMNHSHTPNAGHKNYHWYATCDIKNGEEILIDYNTLEEPKAAQEVYQKRTSPPLLP